MCILDLQMTLDRVQLLAALYLQNDKGLPLDNINLVKTFYVRNKMEMKGITKLVEIHTGIRRRLIKLCIIQSSTGRNNKTTGEKVYQLSNREIKIIC